jgi:hypothetical protein
LRTLIIERRVFRDGLWLDTGGSPLTDAAKVTEKFRRLNYGTLEIELTIDDSKAYTKPWSIKVTQIIASDTELFPRASSAVICSATSKSAFI